MTPNGNGGFVVSGSNTYADPGVYEVRVLVTHLSDGQTLALNATVTVTSEPGTSTPTLTPTQAAIIGEQPVFHRKRNKKGKPIGKAVLTGFMLDFNAPLSSAAAAKSANYQVDTITFMRVKKQTQRILHPITNSTVSYVAASDAVEITLGAAETFPRGGQITILGGLTSASGGTLTGNAVFTISKGGTRIGPS